MYPNICHLNVFEYMHIHEFVLVIVSIIFYFKYLGFTWFIFQNTGMTNVCIFLIFHIISTADFYIVANV